MCFLLQIHLRRTKVSIKSELGPQNSWVGVLASTPYATYPTMCRNIYSIYCTIHPWGIGIMWLSELNILQMIYPTVDVQKYLAPTIYTIIHGFLRKSRAILLAGTLWCRIAIEHGPVEIVDLPSQKMVITSIVFCQRLPQVNLHFPMVFPWFSPWFSHGWITRTITIPHLGHLRAKTCQGSAPARQAQAPVDTSFVVHGYGSICFDPINHRQYQHVSNSHGIQMIR